MTRSVDPGASGELGILAKTSQLRIARQCLFPVSGGLCATSPNAGPRPRLPAAGTAPTPAYSPTIGARGDNAFSPHDHFLLVLAMKSRCPEGRDRPGAPVEPSWWDWPRPVPTLRQVDIFFAPLPPGRAQEPHSGSHRIRVEDTAAGQAGIRPVTRPDRIRSSLSDRREIEIFGPGRSRRRSSSEPGAGLFERTAGHRTCSCLSSDRAFVRSKSFHAQERSTTSSLLNGRAPQGE